MNWGSRECFLANVSAFLEVVIWLSSAILACVVARAFEAMATMSLFSNVRLCCFIAWRSMVARLSLGLISGVLRVKACMRYSSNFLRV